jgi:hypothetical protein
MIMSAITSGNPGVGFLARSGIRGRHNLLANVRLIAEAFKDAMAASRRYQELTARGATPDRAVAQVFSEIYAARRAVLTTPR